MELNKPVIQDLLRQLFAATMSADEARAQAFGHLDGLRDLIPEWIEKIACEGNADGTVTLYLETQAVRLTWEDVRTQRGLDLVLAALPRPQLVSTTLYDADEDVRSDLPAEVGSAEIVAEIVAAARSVLGGSADGVGRLRGAVARYDSSREVE